MSEREKTLTVESMQGHERALQRKGGEGHPHTLTPAKYVARIDRAYRAGSGEPVNAVWETLADRQPRR